MVHYLQFIKAICKKSNMWELCNPRVIGMVNNILVCVQSDENIDRKNKELFIDIVISNLIIFSKYDVNVNLEN